MINDNDCKKIFKFNLNEQGLLEYFNNNKICMSFTVGRLAKENILNYSLLIKDTKMLDINRR